MLRRRPVIGGMIDSVSCAQGSRVEGVARCCKPICFMLLPLR